MSTTFAKFILERRDSDPRLLVYNTNTLPAELLSFSSINYEGALWTPIPFEYRPSIVVLLDLRRLAILTAASFSGYHFC